MPRYLFLSFLSIFLTSAAYGQLNASPCPNDPSIIGYTNWETLKYDANNLNPNGGVVFVLCPGTTFNAIISDIFWIRQDNTILSCGPDGDSNGGCVIWSSKGINIHGLLSPSPISGIEFRGITFEEQTGEIIVEQGSSVAFQDCVFQQSLIAGDRSYQEPPVRVRHGFVSFTDCRFEDNQGGGAVSIWEGTGSFDRCSFRSNSANNQETMTVSAIVAGRRRSDVNPQVQISISNSCFENNFGSSVVYVHTNASVIVNSGNSGIGNSAICNGIVRLELDDEQNELTFCDEFDDEKACPTISPTSMPTNTASFSPTTRPPTINPTPEIRNRPSLRPTTFPTPLPSSQTTDSPTTSVPSRTPSRMASLAPSDHPTTASPSRSMAPSNTSIRLSSAYPSVSPTVEKVEETQGPSPSPSEEDTTNITPASGGGADSGPSNTFSATRMTMLLFGGVLFLMLF